MQAANRVAKNTLILYLRMAITVCMSLYTMRLVLAALGADDFGIFNVVGGAIVMFTFLNAAMASATQRFMSFAQGEGDYKKQKNIFNVSVLLHLFIAVIVVLLLELVGYFLFNGILQIDQERLGVAKLVFQFLVVSTFFTIVSVPYDAVINAHENMLFVAILGILEAMLKLGIAFYITYTSFDKLATYGLLMAALTILLLFVRRIYCHKKYEEVEINVSKYYNKGLFKEMTNFASWSFLGASSSMISSYGQGIVINMFFGTVVNASQGVALQISGQLGAFANTMIKALNPIIAKSEGAGDRSLMLQASSVGTKMSFFLLMIFYVPVLFEMPYLFQLWLKVVPEYAVIFCKLLLLRNLIEQFFLVLFSTIAAVGNIRKFQTYLSIVNITPLIASYILFALNYPAYYLYIVFIVYSTIKASLVIYFAKEECGLSIADYFKNVITRCVMSFVILMAITAIPYSLMSEGFLRFVVVGIVSTFFFAFVVGTIGLTEEEKIYFKMMFKNFKNKFLGKKTMESKDL